MRAARVPALSVAPARAGVEQDVALEPDVLRGAALPLDPELVGVFAALDRVVPPEEVALDRPRFAALVREPGVEAVADAAALDADVLRAAPEFDAVAVADAVPQVVHVEHAPADPRGLAAEDRDALHAAAAKAVRGAVADGEALVDDVVRGGLVDAVDLARELDRAPARGGVARVGAHEHGARGGVEPEVAVAQQLRGRPALEEAARVAVVEDDVADVGRRAGLRAPEAVRLAPPRSGRAPVEARLDDRRGALAPRAVPDGMPGDAGTHAQLPAPDPAAPEKHGRAGRDLRRVDLVERRAFVDPPDAVRRRAPVGGLRLGARLAGEPTRRRFRDAALDDDGASRVRLPGLRLHGSEF